MGDVSYSSLLTKYGPTAQGCGWKSPATQIRRFEVLLDLYKLRSHVGRTILDVGCGCGDLAPLACERGLVYTGIDECREMVMAAQRKYPHQKYPHARFYDLPLRDVAERYDVVVASGLFTHVRASEFMAMIEQMIQSSLHAVAFNCLSTLGEEHQESPDEFLASPMDTFEWCRTLVPSAILRHDYHPGDFTIYLWTGL